MQSTEGMILFHMKFGKSFWTHACWKKLLKKLETQLEFPCLRWMLYAVISDLNQYDSNSLMVKIECFGCSR